jgi:hypothetical protein
MEETASTAGTATMKTRLLEKLLLCCQNGVPANSSQMHMPRIEAIHTPRVENKAASVAVARAGDV